MFWEQLDKVRDVDFLEAIKKYGSLVISKLRYILVDDNSESYKEQYVDYRKDLTTYAKLYDEKIENLNYLVDYLILTLVANTRYHSIYVRKYAEKYWEKMEEKLPNKIPIWEFINIASLSRNNDLHLERMDIDNGYVNICKVRETYAKECIRVKLRELVEKIKRVELPESEEVKSLLNKINDYLKDKVDFDGLEGIKALNYKGNIPMEWHPPCIRGILNDILSGGSPSHYARRSFVVYWFVAKFDPNLRPIENNEINDTGALDIAKEDEVEDFLNEIITIFKSVGDFDVEKTKYYISNNIGYKVANHITHCEYCKNWKEDGGKGLSYYCKPDEICKRRNVIHPLDYLCYSINQSLNRNLNQNQSKNKNKG
jgi:DNA primase large subunit